MDLDDPVAVALLAADALEHACLAYALYGGLALAAYGEPRETRDADVAVLEPGTRGLVEALAVAGVSATVAFEDAVFGGLLVGRVTVLGAKDDTGLNTIDLVRARDHDTPSEPSRDRVGRLCADRRFESSRRRTSSS